MTELQTQDSLSQPKRKEPFLSRALIRNYKSIGHCAVSLNALTILVGRNGAGKSNFVDALRFVYDALTNSLDYAIKSRGGIDEVRRRSTGHPRNFEIRFQLNLPTTQVADYGFEIAARQRGSFVVKKEKLTIRKPDGSVVGSYALEDDKVIKSSAEKMPPVAPDRLYLVNAAGLPEFRAVFDVLTSIGFYNLNPDSMKELQSPDAGDLLHRDGGNIASVLARLRTDSPDVHARIKKYLATIVPDISDVDRIALGPKETLEFRQQVVGSNHPWKFYAANMSDGTLRALGTLVAVTQLVGRKDPIQLVAIEEPETALHPAAAEALMGALREASSHTQILVTSHSPDLLDQIDPRRESLLIVQATKGKTEIGAVNQASRDAIQKHLYTPGELLRMDQFEVDRKDIEKQLSLFEDESD